MQYNYRQKNRDLCVLYFWLGRHSTKDEQGTAAALTVELDDQIGRSGTVQVRVVQGKEPPHFLRIFKGTFITLTVLCCGVAHSNSFFSSLMYPAALVGWESFCWIQEL